MPTRALVGLTVLGFALRLTYGLARGEDALVNHGYTLYHEIAARFLAGEGLCISPGVDCAVRVPVYPLFVSALLQFDWLYPGVPILQAGFSASKCLVAWAIGRTLFNSSVGLIAGALVAVNPYSIVHSTALQETSLFNLLIALSVLLLLHTRNARRDRVSLAAGVVLGVAMLTTARLALFVPFAILWAALPVGEARVWRWRNAVLVSLPVILLVGGWVARNRAVTGAPVLTTEVGMTLWVASHPVTFDYLPKRSIDEAAGAAFAQMPAHEQQVLSAIQGEVARDRVLAGWAIDSMLANPVDTLSRMARKVAWAFSGQLSPARGWIVQLGFALFFAPLNAAGLLGLWRSRREADRHLLVYLLFAAYMVTTAVFWAHTSHSSTMHLFLSVYAASALIGTPGTPGTVIKRRLTPAFWAFRY